jgi:hypothetical protein
MNHYRRYDAYAIDIISSTIVNICYNEELI